MNPLHRLNFCETRPYVESRSGMILGLKDKIGVGSKVAQNTENTSVTVRKPVRIEWGNLNDKQRRHKGKYTIGHLFFSPEPRKFHRAKKKC